MGRVLCIDPGTKRTGLAVLDPSGIIPQGLPTLEHKDEDQLIRMLDSTISKWGPDLIVIGLPLSPDGSPTPRSEAVIRLGNRIRNRFKVLVEYQDECWSSNRACEILSEASSRRLSSRQPAVKGRTKKAKLASDRIAAVLILEDWLASGRHAPGKQPVPGQND